MTAIHPVTDSSTLTVRCPADGRIVGTVQIDPPATVAAKADALRLFQPEWEALGPRGRKPWLLSYQEWVLDNAERITDLVQSESGKTRSDAGLEAPREVVGGAVDRCGAGRGRLGRDGVLAREGGRELRERRDAGSVVVDG